MIDRHADGATPERCPYALCDRIRGIEDEKNALRIREQVIEPGEVWEPSCKHAIHIRTGISLIFSPGKARTCASDRTGFGGAEALRKALEQIPPRFS